MNASRDALVDAMKALDERIRNCAITPTEGQSKVVGLAAELEALRERAPHGCYLCQEHLGEVHCSGKGSVWACTRCAPLMIKPIELRH